jgi:cytochrome c oxidase subunit I
MLLTSVMVLIAFPVLAAALLVLEIDSKLGAQVFSASSGGAVMWQNLFWFFGHPEVYIVAIPFFGIATEVLPVFSRKPLFGYDGMVGATIAIAGLSMTVWAHHMFTTGAVLLPFFSFMTFLIAAPTGVKFLQDRQVPDRAVMSTTAGERRRKPDATEPARWPAGHRC